MKTAAFRGILFTVIILTLVTCVSFPKTRFTIEELSGTQWVNNEYPESSSSHEAQITTDGKVRFYSSFFPNEQGWIGKLTITESWYDKKGDLWFKGTWKMEDTTPIDYWLSKISKSGTVWETCSSGAGYPVELNPVEYNNFIYYRQ